jgi:hypothetical protein
LVLAFVLAKAKVLHRFLSFHKQGNVLQAQDTGAMKGSLKQLKLHINTGLLKVAVQIQQFVISEYL